VSLCGWNIVLCTFGRLFIIPISLSLMGSILGLLPFSGVMLRVFLSVSRSLSVNCVSSPMRIPVSLRHWSTADRTLPEPDMSRSISCSVGMNGSFAFMV